MGYHATVQAALKGLIDAAVTVPVLEGIEQNEAQMERLASFVLIVREGISLGAHEEINPATTAAQYEEWTWALYVVGGGGGSRLSNQAASVDTVLETLRTALNARQLTSRCGPLWLSEEVLEGRHGNGVMYIQRWRHDRY